MHSCDLKLASNGVSSFWLPLLETKKALTGPLRNHEQAKTKENRFLMWCLAHGQRLADVAVKLHDFGISTASEN